MDGVLQRRKERAELPIQGGPRFSIFKSNPTNPALAIQAASVPDFQKASSAEFVGIFWLGQRREIVI